MHKLVHQQDLGDNGAIGQAVRFHAMMEQEQGLEHVRWLVVVREPIPKMTFAIKERAHQDVTRMICQWMLQMYQIQQFGLVLMDMLMDPFAQKGMFKKYLFSWLIASALRFDKNGFVIFWIFQKLYGWQSHCRTKNRYKMWMQRKFLEFIVDNIINFFTGNGKLSMEGPGFSMCCHGMYFSRNRWNNSSMPQSIVRIRNLRKQNDFYLAIFTAFKRNSSIEWIMVGKNASCPMCWPERWNSRTSWWSFSSRRKAIIISWKIKSDLVWSRYDLYHIKMSNISEVQRWTISIGQGMIVEKVQSARHIVHQTGLFKVEFMVEVLMLPLSSLSQFVNASVKTANTVTEKWNRK